jgi:hypothetical protein
VGKATDIKPFEAHSEPERVFPQEGDQICILTIAEGQRPNGYYEMNKATIFEQGRRKGRKEAEREWELA